MTDQKKIKVTLVKSLIGTIESHRACARGLGLRHREHTVEVLAKRISGYGSGT